MINFHNTITGRVGIYRLMLLFFLCGLTILVGIVAAAALEKPVAKVNGTNLTETDLEQALNEIMPAGIFHGGFSSKKRDSYRPRAFERMIEKELFYQEAIRKKIKVAEELIQKEKAATIKRLGGEDKFKIALKRAGLTDKQYEEKLRKKYVVKQFVVIEIKNKAQVTDQEIKAYYKKNMTKYMRPEARRIRHILIKVPPNALPQDRMLKKQKAQEALEKIKAGEDMSLVAWDYSNGPFRVKGGDFGLVHKGRLDPSLEKKAFELVPGQVSDIIETRYGYHIVRVEEVKPPAQLSVEDVSHRIQKELTVKKEKQIKKALITQLKSKARIEKH